MSSLIAMTALCRWLGPRRVLRLLRFRAGRMQLHHDFAALKVQHGC